MSDEMSLAVVIASGVVLGLLILVGLPVVMGIRMSARHRELEHQERMKALELGRPWPGEQPAVEESHASSSRDRGARIGIWVPLGALGIALAATSGRFDPGATMTHMAIWISSSAVGVAGVICGTILAMQAPPSPGAPPPSRVSYKPPLEEDALDIVSRRG